MKDSFTNAEAHRQMLGNPDKKIGGSLNEELSAILADPESVLRESKAYKEVRTEELVKKYNLKDRLAQKHAKDYFNDLMKREVLGTFFTLHEQSIEEYAAAEQGIDDEQFQQLRSGLLDNKSYDEIAQDINLEEGTDVEDLINTIIKQSMERKDEANTSKKLADTKRLVIAKRDAKLGEAVELTKRDMEHSKDELTGAHTRGAMKERFDMAFEDLMKSEKEHDVLLLITFDLNKFKDVNDKYGHRAGDLLLKAVVAQFKKMFPRASDSICRRGGDEFTILMTVDSRAIQDYEDEMGTKKDGILTRLMKAIDNVAVEYEGNTITTSATGGIRIIEREETNTSKRTPGYKRRGGTPDYENMEEQADTTAILQKIKDPGKISHHSAGEIRREIFDYLNASVENRKEWAKRVAERNMQREILATRQKLRQAEQDKYNPDKRHYIKEYIASLKQTVTELEGIGDDELKNFDPSSDNTGERESILKIRARMEFQKIQREYEVAAGKAVTS